MKTIQIALAASLGLALAPFARATDATASGATTETQTQTQTRTQDRDHVRAQVHHALVHDGEATEQEASEVDGEVSDHAKHEGYGPAIKKAIADAHAAGCKGPCQVKLIHAINGGVDSGKTPDQAAKDATAKVAAHATGKPADPQARSEQHRRDGSHRDADRDAERSMDRSMDRSADRAMDRAHDRTQDSGHAGSHMGAGHR